MKHLLSILSVFNKDSLIQGALGGASADKLLLYTLFALGGFVLSLLIERGTSQKKIKERGGFSFGFWWLDNWRRILTSVFVIVVGVLFSKQVFNIELSNWTCFLSGLSTDYIVAKLKKFKSGSNTEPPNTLQP